MNKKRNTRKATSRRQIRKSRCACNMRAGSKKRKQTGGTAAGISAFWNRPWLSTVPENMLQHSGIHWSGQPASVSLYPTVHDYKLLSDYNPVTDNYGRGALSTI